MRENKPDFIVIIASCSFPFGSASDNAIYTFMAGFNEHGCDGEVVCLYPLLPKTIDIPHTGIYKEVKYVYLHGKVHASNNRIRRKLDETVIADCLLRRYLRKKAKQYNLIALFVTHVDETFYRHTRICHVLGINTVLVSCEYPEYLKQNTPERINRFKKLSSCIDKYVFETKTLDDYSRKALDRDIDSIVIPATMPFEDIIAFKRQEKSPYIAYCGSIHSEAKDGLKNIVKAFSIVNKKYPDIELKFIGRIVVSKYYEELLSLVKELGLSNKVFFTGAVDRSDYVQYLGNSCLLIVAKPNDSYYGGGLSSKVIEYLFSGIPVLMTSADDYVNYLTHKQNVYFVEDNQPERLSAAMMELFGNSSLMSSIGKAGREYALKHFNYHLLTKTLLQFIKE